VQGVPSAVLGKVTGSKLTIQVNSKPAIHAEVTQLENVWKDAIPCLMK
jgi:hypothetical protein